MIETKVGLVFVRPDAKSATIVLREAVKCGGCGRMAMIVVNKEGTTTCVTCSGT